MAVNFQTPSDTKPTNPKDAIGSRKVGTHMIPFRVLRGVAMAFLEGALKYGSYNWRSAGARASIYYDAAAGHMGDFWDGQDIDRDSGRHHIDKAIASLIILRDSIYQGNWQDDRPIKARGELVSRNEPQADKLISRYPNPVQPFTEKPLVSRDTGPLEALWAKNAATLK